MKRAGLYVRVSTEEQKKHGLSVDNQIASLREYCETNGYDIVGIYNDAGISARKKYTKRPALLSLMEDCKAGKIDIILFTRLDRWFRSVGDYYQVQAILDEAKVPWKTIWEDYETETSSGQFKVNIMLSIAQAEADRTSEKIRSVKEFQRERGDYVGTPPTGYVMRGSKLYKDEEKKEAVQEFFNAYLETYRTIDSMNVFKSYGYKINYRQARAMLKNTTYTGNAFGHICEPYITVEQHEDIVRVMTSRRRKPKYPDNVYKFSGLVKCGCCGGCTAGKVRRYYNTLKDGTRIAGESTHYRCSKHVHKYDCIGTEISENKLEQYLLNNIETLVEGYNASLHQSGTIDYGANIKTLEGRLQRVMDMYEDGDLTRDEYRKKRDEIQKDLLYYKSISSIDHAEKEIHLPDNFKDMYSELTEENKKFFWQKIIKKVTIYRRSEGKDPLVEFN